MRYVLVIQQSQLKSQTIRQSFLIRSQSPLNLLLIAYWRAKKEVEGKKGDNILFQKSFYIKNDYTLLSYAIFKDKNLLKTNSSLSKEKNDWENDDKGWKEFCLFTWMDSGNTSYIKKKLIQILLKKVLISKQR